jgi:hypothetical protein
VKFSILLTATLLLTALLMAQTGTPRSPGLRQAEKAEQQSERNVPPPLYAAAPVDMTKLKHDADQLASLAQSIPADIEGVQKGTLPKDLVEKLTRIEKLSKHLRSALDH